MKIGIMSMQRIINYGSFMQALSLKTILEALGHEVVFVDYKAEPSIQHLKSLRYWTGKLTQHIRNTWLFWTIANLFRGRPIKYRIPKAYTAEERAFIPALRALGIDYECPHYHTKVDALIIGSDEVFNCLQNADNVGYSLELFGKNNCAGILISYAASFGNTTLERLKKYGVQKQIAYYLGKFDSLSVRDENSAHIVRALTGKEPFQHLDPALIGGIEKMQWEETSERNYIAVYAYPHRISKAEGEDIMSFAKKRSLRVLSLCGEQQISGFENIQSCTPYAILSYIKHASYIITDTFHGTIFSAIYHIPFAVYCRKPQDVSYSNSEKLLDLLKKLRLTDRLITSDKDLDTIFERDIDFDKVDWLRETGRSETLKYLTDILGR